MQVKVGDDPSRGKLVMNRAALTKACRGPDGKPATAAVAQVICSYIGIEYNEAMSLQFFHQNGVYLTRDIDGRHGVYDALIAVVPLYYETFSMCHTVSILCSNWSFITHHARCCATCNCW